jgi:hypothetical protein
MEDGPQKLSGQLGFGKIYSGLRFCFAVAACTLFPGTICFLKGINPRLRMLYRVEVSGADFSRVFRRTDQDVLRSGVQLRDFVQQAYTKALRGFVSFDSSQFPSADVSYFA